MSNEYGKHNTLFPINLKEISVSLVEKFAPHLPYLRRFSRALTGSQVEGDTYVRTALEALVAGETDIDDSLSAKVSLYRMFLAIWSVTGAQLEVGSDDDLAAAARVRRLTPLSRQAFLLSSLEGMTIDEIASVMNVDTEQAQFIFITAFPERLLTGEKAEPAYLISKPFKPENVKAAISQALFFHSA